jgi:hypothetical protein
MLASVRLDRHQPLANQDRHREEGLQRSLVEDQPDRYDLRVHPGVSIALFRQNASDHTFPVSNSLNPVTGES